jgi:ATP-dependent helicase/DNAse subunit B
MKEKDIIEQGGKLKIIGTELKLNAVLEKKTDGSIIRLNGIIDRVDELDGVLRIIDYKTGKVEQKELNLKEMDGIRTHSDYTKALQLLTYAFLYADKFEITKSTPMIAGIMPIKNLDEGLKILKIPHEESNNHEQITPIVISHYKEEISLLIKEILNPELPFQEKPD